MLARRGAGAGLERSADPTVSSPSDTTPSGPLEWTAADARAVDLIRVLAMDAVQEAGSGHPGTAMSLAPAAHLLYQRVPRHGSAGPGVLGPARSEWWYV